MLVRLLVLVAFSLFVVSRPHQPNPRPPASPQLRTIRDLFAAIDHRNTTAMYATLANPFSHAILPASLKRPVRDREGAVEN